MRVKRSEVRHARDEGVARVVDERGDERHQTRRGFRVRRRRFRGADEKRRG